MTQETLGITGHVTIEHIRDGKVIDKREGPNLVVDTGLAEAAALLLTDASGTDFDYIAIGSGSTSPVAGDTALETEVERQSATGTQITTSVTDDTAQLQTTFSFTGTETLNETGIFNAASTGTLFARQTFSTVNVESGDDLQITWQIQFS